jgi:hypothetical protein
LWKISLAGENFGFIFHTQVIAYVKALQMCVNKSIEDVKRDQASAVNIAAFSKLERAKSRLDFKVD